MKKFFTVKSKTITGAALVLGAAAFVSRIIGVVRDRIFAHYFGASEVLDVYYAAFRVPDLVYNLLILGALSAGFIPVFLSVWEKNEKHAWRVTNSILHILGFFLVTLLVPLYFLLPTIIPHIVPGFSTAALGETVTLSRIMLLSPLILGMSGIVSGVLQSRKSFFIYSLTPILYNIGIILGVIFLVPYFGTKGLAYGVILGAILHFAIQIPTLFSHGYSYQPLLLLQDNAVRKIGKLMIPRTVTLATQQIHLLVITILASQLGAGSITVFTFAQNLQFFPIGIIGISFALAAFPTLSEFHAKKSTTAFINYLTQTIKQILFLILPCTVIFLLLRAQIVRVVLGSGQFDWQATILTADILAFFTISFFAQCLIPLLIRAFYAKHNTITPLIISIIATAIHIILSISLKNMFGIRGLALAFSIGACIQTALLWFGLRHTVAWDKTKGILSSLYKICLAVILMALTTQGLKYPFSLVVPMDTFWGIFSHALLSGGCGIIIYLITCYSLKTEELLLLKQSIEKKWLKGTKSQPEIIQN